jgi:5-methylcytosine-specific restriction enzyme A
MSRTTAEWIGKSDDAMPPPRVRLRIFRRFNGKCQECGLPISGKRWICDHRIALINGGENREKNLGPIHETCNKTKTAADVAEKSKVYKKAVKNIGISLRKGPKIRSGGFQPAAAQRQASRPVDKWRGYSP